ncbi:hypothetical protein C8J56DRAFT_1007765 [Mycena floridula]|nr:hypothetical protein C8J56DRAFT_1007765 [Mycena floridula]
MKFKLPSISDSFDINIGNNGHSSSPYPPHFNAYLQNPYSAAAGHSSVASSSRLDPASVPLPLDDDDDFPSANDILPGVAQPTQKVAGSRRSNPDPKGKGKEKHDKEMAAEKIPEKKRKRNSASVSSQPAKKSKGGRAAGAQNYSAEDIDALLDILETELPLGIKGWNSVGDFFSTWAEENERPQRAAKSLELKFKQWVRLSKPTGDGYCPPHIERAHIISDMMMDKAGSHDLDDDEIANEEPIDVSSDSDSDGNKENRNPVKKKSIVKTEPGLGPVARRPAADRLPTRSTGPRRSNPGQDLLSTISSALTPEAQLARNEAHSARTMQATQLFSLNNRIRDLERSNESLRQQVSDAHREIHAAERRADRAEFMLEVQAQGVTTREYPSQLRSVHRRPDIIYPEGGRSRRNYTVTSDMEDGEMEDMSGMHDSEGTRRGLIEDSWSPEPPAFHSAASGLNNMLPTPPAPPASDPSHPSTSTRAPSSPAH